MANSGWVWLTVEDAIAIHDDQIQRFGGLAGVKSLELLESALAAPLNLWTYTGENRILYLAARLAEAIARNHPFVDGNKRTATIAFLEFLYLYSLEIDIEDSEKRQPLASLMERLAAGEIGHREFATTLRPFVIASAD